ncbi:hypothetical protein CDD80_2572 [Ophiocordyceps camponoti-rufipedis]|uniref:Alpha/beta hydrolase fold-3 domain-containing protein n=1 Tax=Ophiocordyceps camponoti-rufipedis TaxID=2004952 RepID=A0A2C5Z5X7_9HYPO|nr:hypothetical protein CDD80_2572 [Ophiocordyceps camponoti-rufipedis]
MPSGCRALLRVRWPPSRPRSRALSTHRVDVRCGGSGHVSVEFVFPSRYRYRHDYKPNNDSLFNDAHDARNPHALVVHLPDSPVADDGVAPLPGFLENLPVAQINYRWGGHVSRARHWPMPVHDTAFAFAWLYENLAPAAHHRRDLFIYGSYLGASLATSLALTESRKDARFSISGLVAFNGIYNWTMFLPEHRIHKLSTPVTESRPVLQLQSHLADLFHRPADLFDPFASPSLFFHSPGLLAPRSFPSTDEAIWDDDDEQAAMMKLKPPRASSSVFPPRKSSLCIPETLLLHHDGVGEGAASAHSLRAQARELAIWMRKSIDDEKRKKFVASGGDDDDDDDDDDEGDEAVGDDEAKLRVQVVDVGPLADEVGATALDWMRERTDAM